MRSNGEGSRSEDDPSQPREPLAGSLYRARTRDGWDLALRRYRRRAEAFPVILCHGYGCSGQFLDYDERRSLARHLAAQGFDAWVLDLRGRGASRPVAAARDLRWRWTFDDFVRFDLPAVISTVQAETGRAQVAWVGHSMGGAVYYAFAGTGSVARESVAAAVTIASPVLLPSVAGQLFRRLGRLLLGLPLPSSVPQRRLVSILWSLLGTTGMVQLGMNPANIDLRLARQVFRRGIYDVSIAKLRQLAFWSAEQVFCSADGLTDYRSALARIETPLLAIAGVADRMAAPSSVRLAVEEIASTDRTFLEIGERSGYTADYGHVDLIFGHRASEEVFPQVSGWLRSRIDRP